jgi:Interleukin-like EMT inducer/Glycosyl hydrolases family 2, TIM barrel domain
MANRVAAAVIASILFSSHLTAQQPVPTAPSLVSVEPGDSRVFVRNRLPDGTLTDPTALVVRGINWSPESVGTPAEGVEQDFVRWYQIDIPLIARMGVNVVRVYHDLGTSRQAFDILDEFYRHDIKVIMMVDSPRVGVYADTQNITAVVNAYKNHPAILMWAVGNEWDLNNQATGFYNSIFPTLAEAASFIEQSAALIKALDFNHPVTTFMADPHIIDFHPLSPEAFPFATVRPYTSEIVSTLVPSVDVWGFNVYRGWSFQDVFQMWRSISTKPMLIGEFGADSYDHRINGENQTMQAQFDTGLWDELYFELSAERVNGLCVGGLVFEFQDEWWKNGDPFHQDSSTEHNYGQPDGFNDEEYFGLMTIAREPKEAYAAMQGRYQGGPSAVVLNATPTLRAISQGDDVGGSGAAFQLNDKTVFQRLGGRDGGRGINVAVLDPHTGIRMQETRNFDTWAADGGWGGSHVHFPELIAYLNGLPDGTILALAIGDEGGFIAGPGGNPWADPFVEQAYEALEALGSQQIRQVPYNGGWAMIVIKGQGVLAEDHSDPSQAVMVEASVTLTLDPDFGRRP